MRHYKFTPRLSAVDEDLTASMMLTKRGSANKSKTSPLPQTRRVVEIVRRKPPTKAPSTPQTGEKPTASTTVKITESSENAAAPVTLQPLRVQQETSVKIIESTEPVPEPEPVQQQPEATSPVATPAAEATETETLPSMRNRADTALTAQPLVVLVRTPSGRIENKYNRSVLHEAVRRGDLGAVKHLVVAQPDLLQQADIRGNLPLHYAANGKGPNAAEIVYVLVKAGAFVNAVNERQQTPLLIHVIANTTDDDMIARILLHNNAKPCINMTETLTLADYASARGLHKIAAALTEYL